MSLFGERCALCRIPKKDTKQKALFPSRYGRICSGCKKDVRATERGAR